MIIVKRVINQMVSSNGASGGGAIIRADYKIIAVKPSDKGSH
jgi:hypothetical protein